jgi:hypothetical protein
MLALIRRISPIALIGGLTLAPVAARAGSAAPDAEAVTYFDEGRKLMAAGKYPEAIARFEESLRHARTVGALLNLGRCYEETGRAASAWATYRAGESLAREMHDAREADAHRFADAIRPRVATLTLDARALAGVDGVTMKRDGVDVGTAARGEAAPVDPGEHVVEVRAPGKTAWHGSIVVKDGEKASLHLPALADAPVAPEPEAANEPASSAPPSSSGARTAGWVAVGAGVVGLGVGSVAGLIAMGKHADAKAACPSYPDHCPSSGAADSPNDAAKSWATVSTVGFIAGGAALATGAVLLFTAPKGESKTTTARLEPVVFARGAGVGVGGAW